MSRATYFVREGDNEHLVEVEALEEGRWQLLLNGQKHVIDALGLTGDLLSLLLDGVSYDVDFEHGKPAKKDQSLATALNVRVHQSVLSVTVMDQRQHRLQELVGSAAASAGSGEVYAPMPGKVVKYLVKAGDVVSAGQGLVVVEAMKMENEIASPIDGQVSELRAELGAAVESGAILLMVQAPSEKSEKK